MKKLVVMFILGIVSYGLNAQTFRNAFDNFCEGPSGGYGQGYSFRSNVDNVLNNAAGLYLESFLQMFKATKDKKYLEMFVIHAKRLIERRDDDIENTYNSVVSVSGIQPFGYPYSGNGCSSTPITDPSQISSDNNINYYNIKCSANVGISYGWSMVESNCLYYTQGVLHSGNITFPMAEFVYLMAAEDPDFTNMNIAGLPVPAECSTNTPNNYNGINPENMTITNFFQFADWLRCRVIETLNFHEWFWNTQDQVFNTPNGQTVHLYAGYLHDPCSPNYLEQCNMDCSIGRTLIYMYLTNKIGSTFAHCPPTSAQTDLWFKHIQDIAAILEFNANPTYGGITHPNDPGAYDWFNDWPKNNNFCEDLAHACIEMQFADLCYKYNILEPDGSPAFTIDDMKKFANSFARNAYGGPHNISPTIYGPGATNVNNTAIIMGQYVFMTKYNPYIYSEISDYFAHGAIYNSSGSGDIEGYSQLALYENTIFPCNTVNDASYENAFNPVAISQSANYNWLAAGSGDLDGNGTQEFVAYDENSNHIFAENIDPNNNDQITISANSNATVSNIIGLASGKLLNTTTGPDILAAIDAFGDIDLLQKSGSTFNSVLAGGPAYLGFNTTAITIGDFDKTNPGDEMLIADVQGNIYLVEYNIVNQTLTIHGQAITQKNPVRIAGIAAGSFDNSGYGEVATINNSTGNLDIYSQTSSGWNQLPVYSYTGMGTPVSSNPIWDGITCGDYDGDGRDEIIAHCALDGRFIVFKVKGGTLVRVTDQAFPDGTQFPDGTPDNIPGTVSATWAWHMGVVTTLKRSPVTANAALVTFRDLDGEITAFDLEGGTCQNLTVRNNYIGDAGSPPSGTSTNPPPMPAGYTYFTALDNPYTALENDYTVDYNVGNTLNATNFMVASASVNFTAGNAINMGIGFDAGYQSTLDAKIDGSFLCNNNLRPIPPKRSNSNGSNYTTNNIYTRSIQVDSLNVLVKQSVTRGQFYIGLNNIDLANMNKQAEVSVWNEFGQQVYAGNILMQKEQYYPIDLSGKAAGIYFVMVKTGNKILHAKVILQ